MPSVVFSFMVFIGLNVRIHQLLFRYRISAMLSIVGWLGKEKKVNKPKNSSFDRSVASKDKAMTNDSSTKLQVRMREALKRTGQGLAALFGGAKQIDSDLLEELEVELLTSDVGVTVTDKIMMRLTKSVEKRDLADAQIVRSTLRSILLEILSSCERPMLLDNKVGPAMILVVGVNGVGKTTTIGKLTHRFQQEGKSVMLAAGDTFRAAAVEQLQVWGQSQDVPVVAQPTGADSASVIFDALESARSKNIDIVIADTAGRLHNKTNLMEELAKVIRVAAKVDPCAPHEVLLVLDATTGQNALSQMAEFETIAGVSGIALTKLDGTAKGGIIFALAEQHKVPVRFIGVGEGKEDLRPFIAKDFVDALLPPIMVGNNT